MSDPSSRLPTRGGISSSSSSPAPPPPPPPAPVQQSKYSNRAASALARFAQPFFSGSRPPSPQTSGGRTDSSAGPRFNRSKSLPGESQTVTHKTGISISALDISPQRTHAVIGGKEILKTIRVSPNHSSEEFNLRNAIISYSSTHHVGSGLSARQKDQLTVRDVKWSRGNYDQIIATAVANGRIVLYDLHRTGLEYCRFQGHSRQVHRLAFNPHWPAWLLSGSQDSSIRMWDLRMASTERGVSVCGSKDQYNGNSDAIRDIRWSPSDGVVFATATDSGAVQLWDYRKASAPLMRITAHDRPCFSVDWHPDGKHIVSGGTDRQVKVWDFSSSGERRQKPTFQFRTPQAVMNVRWRPPSWAREPQGSGDWQSTQLVTSYDKEDPRIHLWDLRRPHIPFREFDRYDTRSADLLWHSKDLLWTAGEAGAFTQTDVRFAPQVVNQRPTCSVAWSPSGEVLAFVQKRPRRSTLGLSTTEFVGHQEEGSSSGEAFSQSQPDDLLDEPSFTPIHHGRSKSTSARPSKSLGSTPPGPVELNPVLPLEKVLSKDNYTEPHQFGVNGIIPGATMGRDVFQYLGRRYSPLLDDLDILYTDPLSSLLDSLGHNAECAEDISLLKLAQTWRIVKSAVIQELQAKAREQRQSAGRGSRGVRKKTSKEGPSNEKARALEDGKHDKARNRLFKGVMETEVPKLSLSDTEPTSTMTTPLARPLPDSPPIGSSDSSSSHMTSLNDPDIQPLPPSVLSSNQSTMNSNDWSSMSDIEPRPILEFHRSQSYASEEVQSISDSPLVDPLSGSMPQAPEEDQRSAPRAITRRADWRGKHHPEIPEEDEYDQKMEDKKAAIRDYKSFPKKVLSLESHMESNRPPGFQRHESSESFSMFSASTESSHPSKLIAASFSSATKPYDVAEEPENDENHTSSPNHHQPRRSSNLEFGSVPQAELQSTETLSESLPDVDCLHLERPSSPAPLLKESTPLETLRLADADLFPPMKKVRPIPPELGDGLSEITIPISLDETGDKPWNASILLKEAIRHYHSSTNVDIQSAAHLLQKLRVLFDDCERILPNEECELIFMSYNEYLMRQSMYIEAAELRLLCVPSYPAVYEYSQVDTTMNVFCFTCKRPYENPKADNSRCYRCNTPQEPCAICMSLEPPPEWVAEVSTHGPSSQEDSQTNSQLLSPSRSSLKTESVPSSELRHQDKLLVDTGHPPRPKGSTLWTWCQGCGHGGHLACMQTWLNDATVSEGGCATPGCMHDCGPGPRRDHNRTVLVEESKKRDSASKKAGVGFVKRDTWAKGESKAVEKVRGMLSAGASGGTAIPGNNPGLDGSSAAVMSPKKVRLVTPSEQGKRRTPRTSIGGGSGLNS
ncbi:SEA (Seh1-associated) complex subunit [Aspergillus nanangensis]|uniref:SEA (Seh1-associated) complex subunit n=1 Tax=Aspergillus nanangensis TaxID=2582783 RepID=A0AAD4CGA7_ASPNN|nr:SEA (Seh1-associated) complex subunit [Aspergillus nanangensis]